MDVVVVGKLILRSALRPVGVSDVMSDVSSEVSWWRVVVS